MASLRPKKKRTKRFIAKVPAIAAPSIPPFPAGVDDFKRSTARSARPPLAPVLKPANERGKSRR